MTTTQPNRKKDYIVALNYAFKYGSYNPLDKEMKLKAYSEFGELADRVVKSLFIL